MVEQGRAQQKPDNKLADKSDFLLSSNKLSHSDSQSTSYDQFSICALNLRLKRHSQLTFYDQFSIYDKMSLSSYLPTIWVVSVHSIYNKDVIP